MYAQRKKDQLMKLYKRNGSSFWWYSFTVDGKQYRGSTKRLSNDKKGAKAVMQKAYQNALDRVQFAELPEISLEDCFEHALVDLDKEQSRRIYRASYRVLYEYVSSKDMNASDFTQDMLEDFLDFRRQQGRKENTLKGDIRAIRRAFNKLEHRYNCPKLKYPSIKGFTKTRYLSDREEKIIFDVLAQNETITARKAEQLCVVLIDTGLRLMEAVTLEWEFIDLNRREIEVYRTKTGTVSLVPISQRVHDLFRRLHNQDQPFESVEEAIKLLRKVIRENCNKSERVVLTRGSATVHSLRDTYASRMVQRGLSIQQVSVLLGHSNISQTMKYAQLEKVDVVAQARLALDA